MKEIRYAILKTRETYYRKHVGALHVQSKEMRVRHEL